MRSIAVRLGLVDEDIALLESFNLQTSLNLEMSITQINQIPFRFLTFCQKLLLNYNHNLEQSHQLNSQKNLHFPAEIAVMLDKLQSDFLTQTPNIAALRSMVLLISSLLN